MATMRTFWLASAALLLAGCVSVPSAPVSDTASIPLWKSFDDKPRGYLPGKAAVDAGTYLAPPPAVGTPQGIADLAVYAATRKLEGSPRWRQAQIDADADTPGAPKAFDCALNAQLDPLKQPILIRMLMRASTDTDILSRPPKALYARPRPFLAQDGPICVAREQWLVRQGSYPSGHSATGWLWGLILSELAPDRAGPIMQRARSFGESRIVCGVHYVSDMEAGRVVAAVTLTRLRSDPVFMADLAVARRELAAARAATTGPAACAARNALDAPAY